MKRGRPRKLDNDAIVSAVVARKSEVVLGTGKIISKNDKVWRVISHELDNIIQPHALFTFVVNNRYKVRDILIPAMEITQTEVSEASIHESSNTLDSSTASVNEENDQQIINITFDKAELEVLLVKKQYSRSEEDRSQLSFREYLVLQPGKWQEAVTKKLWEACKKKCAFQFKRNKIYNDKLEVLGKCNCGSVIKGSITRLNFNSETNMMTCAITSGDGTCGKRYLRDPIRLELGKMLCETNKTAEVHRAAEADQMMSSGDPEPPHLYKAEALRKAKEQYQASLTLHKNPVTSILHAQLSSLKYFIHNLGLNQFYVHYWSNLQTNVYKQYTLSKTSSIAIDATGSVVRKINRPDGSKSKHIFLYTCVVNSPDAEKCPITQMLSESQTTNSICFWLMEWIRTGAPPPKEVTCDASKALLLAATRTFTNCASVHEYADKCWGTSDMPVCYIRIDVAHFIKTYANFLEGVINPKIKAFYMASIGQLILTRTVSILAISQSKTEGSLENGRASLCEVEKAKLNDLLLDITCDTNVPENPEDDVLGSVEIDDTGRVNNMWSDWAMGVLEKVSSESIDTGDRVNAHYFPQLADRLLKDMKWFPLWSCICRDRFGYGRVPASSAAVESEFNNIKNRLLANETLPIRADVFLQKHAEHINGRMKIKSAKNDSPNCLVTTDEAEIIEPVEQRSDTACPACAMRNEPFGAHACIICGAFVHALEECSKSLQNEEEGYGQRRLCIPCSRIPKKTAMNMIDSGERENWGGLSTEPPKKKSRYLQKNFTHNQFLLPDKIKTVPILKNGSSLNLEATNLKGNRVSLLNTCAFDGVYQIFLTAAFDSVDFRDECRRLAETNIFFKMIKNSAEKGITRNTYHLRTEALIAIFPAEPSLHNTLSVQCAVTVKTLCQKLFQSTPCVMEVSSCDEGCPPRIKPIQTVPVDRRFLLENDFSNAVDKDFLLIGATHCCRKNCIGIETTAPPKAESSIICDVNNLKDLNFNLEDTGIHQKDLDVYPENYNLNPEENATTELCKVPREIKLSFMTKSYKLRGVVHWKPPGPGTRRSDSEHQAIGHYTPICFRPDQSWVQYDDTQKKGKIIPNNFPAKVHLIVYSV